MKNWLGREPEINDLQTENRPVRPITGLVLTFTILQLNELHVEITCGVSLFTPLDPLTSAFTDRPDVCYSRPLRLAWEGHSDETPQKS